MQVTQTLSFSEGKDDLQSEGVFVADHGTAVHHAMKEFLSYPVKKRLVEIEHREGMAKFTRCFLLFIVKQVQGSARVHVLPKRVVELHVENREESSRQGQLFRKVRCGNGQDRPAFAMRNQGAQNAFLKRRLTEYQCVSSVKLKEPVVNFLKIHDDTEVEHHFEFFVNNIPAGCR